MPAKKTTKPEAIVRDIQRNTRRKFAANEKIRIVLEGLRGEDSVAEICRKEGISPNLYYTWSKHFLEAGKRQLNGDTRREATGSEVQELKEQNENLKQVVAELLLETRVLKKSLTGNH